MDTFDSSLVNALSPIALSLSQKVVRYEKIIRPAKRPDLQFVIKPLTEEHLIPCAKLLAHSFCAHNNVYKFFKVSEDLYFERIAVPLIKKNIKHQLGIVCVDPRTNEVMALSLNDDYSTEDTEPYYTNRHPLLDRRGRYHDIIKRETKKMMDLFPKGKGETIYVRAVATSPKAEGLGLFTELLRFTMFEHPIIKKSKILYSVATHPASGYAMLKCGFQNTWKKEWREYANIKGYEEFAGVGQIGMTQGKITMNGVLFNVFDRHSLILRPGL